MPFLLYFVRTEDMEITGGEVRNHFKARTGMALKSSGVAFEAEYKNPQTKATCTFTFNKNGIEAAREHEGEAYDRAQLSCRINYLRSSLHARAAIAEVADIVEALLLMVLNPQSAKRPDIPDMFMPEEVLTDWVEGNRTAIAAFMKRNGPIPYVTPKLSGMLWNYQMARAALEESVGEDVEVPAMRVFFDTETRTSHTAFEMDGCVPMVLPACKSVIISRVLRKGFFGFGRREEDGMARFEDVVEALGPYLETVTIEEPEYTVQVLSPEKAEEAAGAFLEIPLDPLPDTLTKVPSTGFVDVLPKLPGRA